uniref:Dickkopf N-terminal cysteine-rich domain-containing protein n=1 Tax=Chromera velia CCMP2878 TaxID=1169474 RepID=A0A0G4G109_9ALVE|eukprot:Cvel_19709.t1-p1 / transcript=Cvel_19709.t1 / gene=Cvel_19709 / organism=Chromera_velia_CCMP2878 / gene_product=hypothetical protein / transcript_product=hypothetical protein / location=Cvel_scaffold1721:1557-2909(-) / protein_length=98 / sequence_SO=supercontig / SO=protein_coding / is_pseudo=false
MRALGLLGVVLSLCLAASVRGEDASASLNPLTLSQGHIKRKSSLGDKEQGTQPPKKDPSLMQKDSTQQKLKCQGHEDCWDDEYCSPAADYHCKPWPIR